jgi:hypothetical protein
MFARCGLNSCPLEPKTLGVVILREAEDLLFLPAGGYATSAAVSTTGIENSGRHSKRGFANR